MNKKRTQNMFVAMLSTLSMLLAGCGGNSSDDEQIVTGDYMTGKVAKKTYNAYLGMAPDTLDSTKSQNAQNLQHIANFSATLLMNNTNSILKKSLATHAVRNSANTQFRFKVRDDVKWVQWDGTPYFAKNEQGQQVQQYVTPEDFVTTAKIILDFRNESEIYYMYTLFVNNAWEYYCYTMMLALIKGDSFTVANRLYDGTPGQEPKITYSRDDFKGNLDKQAECVMNLVFDNSGEDWYDGNTGKGHGIPITGSDINDIKNFKRVGVKVEVNDLEEKELVYSLNQQAPFFPTMLTYTPFMPINAHFYEKNKASYGLTKDKILYCGPFRCVDFSATNVVYERNKDYFYAYETDDDGNYIVDKDGNKKETVHLDRINYQVVDANVDYKKMREDFDAGHVDGFSLSETDDIGWKKYITGEDGKGTIQEPASSLVNSRELNSVDFTYHFVLNQNRDYESFKLDQSTAWTGTPVEKNEDLIKAEIKNTNNALKIYELRKLILDGIDLNVYNKSNNLADNNQYQINTFTPRGYVYDDAGKDYVEYYYEEYARQKGITRDEAYELLKPQQIKGVNMSNEEVKALAADGKEAIELYNKAHPENKITLPIYVEYNSIGGLAHDQQTYEDQTIRTWNERVNCCTLSADIAAVTGLPLCSEINGGKNEYPFMNMIANETANQSTFTDLTNNGKYTVYTGWGWKGDYADPLTYMHCYVTHGEMSKQSGNTDYFNDYRLVRDAQGVSTGVLASIETDHTTNQLRNHMFAEYNSKVEEARAENQSLSTRFSLFAEAEYMLLNELKVMKPCTMRSQGWVASVSRAAGYEAPESPYGVSEHVMIGIWVLKDVPTGEERKECRDLHDARKKKAIEDNGGKTIDVFNEVVDF